MTLTEMIGAMLRAVLPPAQAKTEPPEPSTAPEAAVVPVDIQPKPPRETKADLSIWQQFIDLDLLAVAFKPTSRTELSRWIRATQDACYRWGIDLPREIASFLANIHVESAGLTQLEENLNYSAEALKTKFGRHRISIANCDRYGRKSKDGKIVQRANQPMIANILYGGEWGKANLGNIYPTDGWDCRGFGPKQVTGRDNQQAFADAMGMSLAAAQAYMRTPEGGMMAAGWFWKTHNLDAKAATPGVRDDRIAINGGTFGLADVERRFDLIIEALLDREAALQGRKR